MASTLEVISSCPVCLISYNGETNKPLMLTCGHPVCGSCVKTLQERNDNKCPVCKTSWEVDDTSNFTVCYSLIIDECPQTNCSIHGFEILFWCNECFQMICKKCVSDDHSKCHPKIIEEADSDIKSYLVATSANVNAKLSRSEKELMNEIKSNEKSREDTQFLLSFCEQMIIKLDKRREDLQFTHSKLQSMKDCTQTALNEVYDNSSISPKRQLPKFQEIFNRLQGSCDISIPKEVDSMGPLIDIIPKLEVR